MTPTEPKPECTCDPHGVCEAPVDGPPCADPAAAELARCVAWLEARAKRFDKLAEDAYYNVATMIMYQSKAELLRDAAADLAAGEQP